jgi:phosphatidylinositol kinase/protein kinase (PI-3  family)
LSVKPALNVNDNENKESKEMLNKISGRLSGIYNIMHPHRDKLITAAAKRGDIPPSRGIGSSRDELLPLSVMGQAQRLIDEATAIENLAQLYIGKAQLLCNLPS